MQLRTHSIVARGVYLYEKVVICHAHIVLSTVRYGTGHAQDEPAIRNDVEQVTFYICYGASSQPGPLTLHSGGYSSLIEAKAQIMPLYGVRALWHDPPGP